MSEIINDTTGLAQVCEQLQAANAIGLDTEFMRERTYFAQLCLLQLSVDDDAFCIDTLALRDLSALRASMGAAQVPKVLHAARQDLEVLSPAPSARTPPPAKASQPTASTCSPARTGSPTCGR